MTMQIAAKVNEPCAGYKPLPIGPYTLEIVESDYGPNATGTGMVLKCKAQVVGGPYADRPFYLSYTLEHVDPVTVEIGQRDFAALRRATGVLALEDSEELHFKSFGVTLGIKARKDTGDLENVVKKYHFDEDGDAAPAEGWRPALQWRVAHSAPQRDERGRFMKRAA